MLDSLSLPGSYAPFAVARDLALPLPLSRDLLTFLLVLFFLVHIAFVNLMLGGSVLTVFFEAIGRKWPRYDGLARQIALTVTVNKSLAVVMGIGPLLCINLLYTLPFYTANTLTGHAWMLIIPLVMVAFLLTYWHKYTWDSWTGKAKDRHILLGGVAAFLLLCIPVIFLANINLMLFPDQWSRVKGFFSALAVGNVFPRLFHFLLASTAFTGLFLAGWLGRRSFPVEQLLPGFHRPELRRFFYKVACYASAAQFVFGPLVLFTLPHTPGTRGMFYVIMVGVAMAYVCVLLLFIEIKSPDAVIGRFYWTVVVLFLGVVGCMGTGRHLYRQANLGPYQEMVQARQQRFQAVVDVAKFASAGEKKETDAPAEHPGKSTYDNVCSGCHAYNTVRAAPPITEIQGLYAGNVAGLVAWAKAPGKKRAQFGPMPSFAMLGEEALQSVAEYMLQMSPPTKPKE
jgi:cytochrome c